MKNDNMLAIRSDLRTPYDGADHRCCPEEQVVRVDANHTTETLDGEDDSLGNEFRNL